MLIKDDATIIFIYFYDESATRQELLFKGSAKELRDEKLGSDWDGFNLGDSFYLNDEEVRVFVKNNDLKGKNNQYFIGPKALNSNEINYDKLNFQNYNEKDSYPREGNMFIRIGEVSTIGNREKEINVISDITDQDYLTIKSNYKSLKVKKHAEMLKENTFKNAKVLKNFLKEIRSYDESDIRNMDENKILFEGNRLLYNFLTSIQTFIDISNRKLSYLVGKEIQEKFD